MGVKPEEERCPGVSLVGLCLVLRLLAAGVVAVERVLAERM